VPAKELGGDFFNYFSLPGGEFAVLIGDVSGKGVPAALLMANIQATLRARLPVETDLCRLVGTLDQEVAGQTPAEAYLTLFVAILSRDGRRMRYVNAGHNSQFLLRADHRAQRLVSTGRPLGLLPGGQYQTVEVDLESGDWLFLYTDGLVEAENSEGQEFGIERLEKLLVEAGPEKVDMILAEVEAQASRHRGGVEAEDDSTLLLLQVG
jgi:sigma-B regulation protein RsbU (phosphoserine phosphatase)